VLTGDLNVLSVLQYAVEVLDVEHVIVCGHYQCGGVKAAMGDEWYGLVDHWLAGIRDQVRQHQSERSPIRPSPPASTAWWS
jgi:carbonic anhydrase